MNKDWTYVGLSTTGQSVAIAVARPRWSLYAGERRPRGTWEPNLLSLERRDREEAVQWIARASRDAHTPVGESPRPVLLIDRSEVGGGDLLLRALERAVARGHMIRKLRMVSLDVTSRDVERSPGVVARRAVLAPLLDAIERDIVQPPRGPIGRDFVEQADALTRRPDAAGAREDLVRAVALCVWAIDLEGRISAKPAGDGRLNASGEPS